MINKLTMILYERCSNMNATKPIYRVEVLDQLHEVGVCIVRGDV